MDVEKLILLVKDHETIYDASQFLSTCTPSSMFICNLRSILHIMICLLYDGAMLLLVSISYVLWAGEFPYTLHEFALVFEQSS